MITVIKRGTLQGFDKCDGGSSRETPQPNEVQRDTVTNSKL